MVERAEIRNTFIYSPIFETVEEVQTNPFVFKTDALEQRAPKDVPDIRHEGYLLRMVVSLVSNFHSHQSAWRRTSNFGQF